MIDWNKERVFYYFEKISRIPRESGNEMAVSNWIYNWTRELGLEAAQDAAFNLVIKKKASEGYETAEPVILQAHMDMVCEKTPESMHDFGKDPILLKEEGDWLTSACGTTLGADNGIGMACAMAILEDETLVHPPLEVIFTVEEETTFKGADSIDPALFSGKRMINMDHADDSELIAGSCGGTGLRFTMPLEWDEEMPKGYEAFRIRVCGLLGGHSGEDIHRGRGNAIRLLMRVLRELHCGGAEVVSINGGTNRLAISREAGAVIMVKKSENVRERLNAIKEILRKEFGKAAPELDVVMESVDGCFLPLKTGEFEKVDAIVRLFPDGIQSMSGELPGLVNSSNNLGIINVSESEGKLSITAEIRGLYLTMVEDIKSRIEILAGIFGAQVEYFAGYVSWEYAQDSALRKTALDVYRRLFGDEMKVATVHAGLEGGSFKEKIPEMDIISIGPDCQFFHSPKERVSIASVRKYYRFLNEILSRMK